MNGPRCRIKLKRFKWNLIHIQKCTVQKSFTLHFPEYFKSSLSCYIFGSTDDFILFTSVYAGHEHGIYFKIFIEFCIVHKTKPKPKKEKTTRRW